MKQTDWPNGRGFDVTWGPWEVEVWRLDSGLLGVRAFRDGSDYADFAGGMGRTVGEALAGCEPTL